MKDEENLNNKLEKLQKDFSDLDETVQRLTENLFEYLDNNNIINELNSTLENSQDKITKSMQQSIAKFEEIISISEERVIANYEKK